MTAKFNRRLAVTTVLAGAGAWATSRVQDPPSISSNIGRIAVPSASRPPLLVAMLDRHVQRIAPLVPYIENSLNRRLQIEALSVEELYSWFTIDLLQQTGRYDVVSLSDEWIPYFGRRGYLANVPSLDENGQSRYPAAAFQAARGIDGTDLVAYPWTFDYAYLSWRNSEGGGIDATTWATFFRTLDRAAGTRVVIGLRAPVAAAQVYRSILLSFGTDLVDETESRPVLDSYAAVRALEVTLRLARMDDLTEAGQRNQEDAVFQILNGGADLTPILWASNSQPLYADPGWNGALLPAGRPNIGRTNATFWMLGVPAAAPHGDEARAFVELMADTETQSRLWTECGLLPATRPAINAEWRPGGAVVRDLAFAALEHSYGRPRLRSFRSMMEITGQMVAMALQTNIASPALLQETNLMLRDAMKLEDELG